MHAHNVDLRMAVADLVAAFAAQSQTNPAGQIHFIAVVVDQGPPTATGPPGSIAIEHAVTDSSNEPSTETSSQSSLTTQTTSAAKQDGGVSTNADVQVDHVQTLLKSVLDGVRAAFASGSDGAASQASIAGLEIRMAKLQPGEVARIDGNVILVDDDAAGAGWSLDGVAAPDLASLAASANVASQSVDAGTSGGPVPPGAALDVGPSASASGAAAAPASANVVAAPVASSAASSLTVAMVADPLPAPTPVASSDDAPTQHETVIAPVVNEDVTAAPSAMPADASAAATQQVDPSVSVTPPAEDNAVSPGATDTVAGLILAVAISSPIFDGRQQELGQGTQASSSGETGGSEADSSATAGTSSTATVQGNGLDETSTSVSGVASIGEGETASASVAADAMTAAASVMSVPLSGDQVGLSLDSQVEMARGPPDTSVSARGPPAADYLLADPTAPFASTPATTLSAADLQSLANVALTIWSDALAAKGLTLPAGTPTFQISDLADGVLGATDGSVISIDIDAAGHGWFVDPTPLDASEFPLVLGTDRLGAAPGTAAAGSMDLLTVLLHEIGHWLGYEHDAGFAVMAPELGTGQRVMLDLGDALPPAGANAPSLAADANTGPVSGTLTESPSPPPAVQTFTLAAESTDTSAITFRIFDDNHNGTPDFQVTGAITGNGIYDDIDTLIGSANLHDKVIVDIDSATVWNLTGLNSGTVTTEGFSAITFSGIENVVGAATAKDTFIIDENGGVAGDLDARGGIVAVQLTMGPVTVIGDVAGFTSSLQTVNVDTDGNGTADLLGATLKTFALDATSVGVTVDGVASLTLSGKLALASVTAAGQTTARYTALKMGDVSVSASTGNASDFGLSGTLTISSLDYNSAASGFARLDWAKAFDLDGDGNADVLDPGALLPTPADLSLGFASSLQYVLSGSITNLVVTAGPVTISGSAEFALSRSTVDVDTDGNGTADLIGATLDELALSVASGTTVTVSGVASLTLSGNLALARVTAAGQTTARYTALKMGDVSVSTSTGNASDFGLSGTLTISSLDYNSAAAGFERLDWAKAFDLDGDGNADVLDPGALLPTPADLSIGFASSLQYVLSGSITNLVVTAGPVTIGGNAEFALSRSTVDVDTDGNGTADLIGATLDELALSVASGTTVTVSGVATLTLSGNLALARVTAAGQTTARYTALKMGDVTVSASTGNASDFGLSGTLTISSLDYNSAAAGFERLDWAKAFDLDGDGNPDVLDPGALLPTPADLSIGFASSLQYVLSGSITNLVVTAGPVTISGSAEFALSRSTVDVDTDGNGTADLIGATLDELALSVASGTTVTVSGVASLTLSRETWRWRGSRRRVRRRRATRR
ncbi:beta strand repeat-containing protein [Rhodoplanes sp. Z2-YC6860]|uniref:beta strand repeat-containing protein n=1 Tax=Rhodoplanes sp. Z2-YC6860 TaxID=674703 RepID=UPI001F2D8275|nr:hypothetical protein [Rhodoplanes sp. Z2-YC6860]